MTSRIRAGAGVLVRPVALRDAAAVARIYNYYVAETIVTFEEDAVAVDEMERRIQEVAAASLPWLVAEQGGEVRGYAYATGWKRRRGYRFSVEVTVYLDRSSARRGIGSRLYAELIPALRAAGFHLAIGGIALPNDASVRLHEKFGFVKVAHFKEVGIKFDRWIDVGYWQLELGAHPGLMP
jgi:L-amino acid N-acyltransferase YncA